MVTQIVIHVLPHEIDWFEWQAKQLKVGSYYIEDKVVLDVTLNLNLVDWSKSKLPKQFFVEKYLLIKDLLDSYELIFSINEDGSCLGTNDKKRDSFRKYKPDNFINLDCDIIFKPETLALLINGAKAVDNPYYIITPQIPKLWDQSWDILVNDTYKDKLYGFQKTIDPFSILIENYGETTLSTVGNFKFAFGWFTLISSELLKLTNIPDSFGPYGIDDTYVMHCCEIMKTKQLDVKQYTIKNLVVAENLKYRKNSYSDYLVSINKQDEYRSQAELNLHSELINFSNKL